jgi:sirohydrochlorin cobaltochelatase
MSEPINLPAIVLATFGTSSPKAREVYRGVEERVRESYPKHEIVWAYLSHQIIDKQRSLGVVLPTLPEVLVKLADSGFREAVVQPLLTVPGEEFAIVRSSESAGLKLSIGAPLLSSENDLNAVLAAISPYVRPGVANVLVCHGNSTYSKYNEQLLRLKKMAENTFDNLIVASIEGTPGVEPLARAREMASAKDTAVFIPFMMTAGEHINRDVMGDEAESWKNIVGVGRSTCLEPLAKNRAILNIFLDHIEVAMQDLREVRQHG